jgi:hypothetical protein
MTDTVLEVVRFRLAEGSEKAAFLTSVTPTTEFLKTKPGFVRRRLSQDADGMWLDIVEWTSMAEAKSAAAEFQTLPAVAEFCSHIDMSTAKMEHYAVQAQQEAA